MVTPPGFSNLVWPFVRVVFLWIAVGVLTPPTPARAEVSGGRAYAHAAENLSINDDFAGGTLARRYQIGGSDEQSGRVTEANGMLYVMAGPTMSQSTLEVTVQRYFYPDQSFHLQIDAGIASDSTGLGMAGLALTNPLVPGEHTTLVGLASTFYSGMAERWVFAQIPGVPGIVTQPYAFALDQLQALQIDYDAATQTLIVSVPDAGFSYLAVLSTYTSGFSLGLISQTSSDGGDAGESVALFDNLTSDLTADPYLVSYTPLTFDGVVYDKAIPNDLGGGNAVYYTVNVPSFSLARVAVDDTWMQLDGQSSISAALVSFGGEQTTVYTELNCATFQAALPSGATLDRFVNNALLASGAGQDYQWNPSPAIFSADCGYGLGVVLWAIEPYFAVGGSDVAVLGHNFGETPGSVSVGGISVEPNTWSINRITFTVPLEVTAGTTTVTVSKETQLASVDFQVVPQINIVYPTELTGGTALHLSGTGFGAHSIAGSVLIDNQPAFASTWSPNQLVAVIPKAANPGPVTVFTVVNGVQSNSAEILISPYIYWVSYSIVKNSPTLIVQGANLGKPVQDAIYGLLLDGQLLPTVDWTSESIQAVLPSNLTTGDHVVEVVSDSMASNLAKFSIRHNQLMNAYFSAVTSSGNPRGLQELAEGSVIPGGLLIDFAPDTIKFLDDTTFEPIERVRISSAQLAGMLKGIGAYRFERRRATEGHQDSYFVYFTRKLNTSTARAILSLAKEVRAVMPLVVMESRWTETYDYPDPAQTDNYNLGKFVAVNVPRANAVERGNPSEWIAVVDSNFPKGMSDLVPNLRNPDALLPEDTGTSYHPHGEFVATICCAASNTIGVAGVAPSSAWAMYPGDYANNIDYTDSKNRFLETNHQMQETVQAIKDGAAVVTMSWGLVRPSASLSSVDMLTQADYDTLKTYWKTEITALLDKYPHVNLVAAVANYPFCLSLTGTKVATDGIPDNLDPRIIAVGGEVACNTSWVQVGAPTGWAAIDNSQYEADGSVKIDYETTEAQTDPIYKPWYGYDSHDQLVLRATGSPTILGVGTSFATPVVAGVAALLHSWNPNLTGAQVQAAIRNTATSAAVPSGFYQTSLYGNGYVDAYAALLYAEKYFGQGKLYVNPMEDIARLHAAEPDLFPLLLQYTVDENTSKTVTITLKNEGDGVLFFQGWAYRCLKHGAFGVCTQNSSDIHFEPASMSATGHHSIGGLDLDEGYIRPGKYHSVDLNVSGIGMKAGDTYDGTIFFFSDANHNDVNSSNYFWMNVKVTVTEPSDCFTSRALVGTPLEKEISGLRKFRDDYMVPQKLNGQKWANLYRSYGPEIVKGFDKNAPEVYVYRMLVDRFGPSLVAKGLKETGLSFLADSGALQKVITKEDIQLAQGFLEALAQVNPNLADIGQRLSSLSEGLEGMTAEEAIEYVTAQDPETL